MSSRSTVASALALSLTVLAGTVLAAIAAELGARLLFPSNIPATERVSFFRYDALLGWSQIPGLRTRFVQRDFDVKVEINSIGLRDAEPVRRRRDASDSQPVTASDRPVRVNNHGQRARQRVLLLGDSFAWGFGVEYGERFSEILERLHPGLEVVNAGVNGYGTDQELLYLRTRTEDLKPDVVLLLFHPNDFENNVSGEQYWYFKPVFRMDGDSLRLENVPVPHATLGQRTRRLLLGRSYLGQSLAVAWRRMRRSDGAEKVRDRRDVSALRRGTRVTERLIREIRRECAVRDVRLLLVSVPMTDGEREVLRGAAAAEGIPYHSLDEAFASSGSSADLYFTHDEHWTRHGHTVAGESISGFLVAEGIVDETEQYER